MALPRRRRSGSHDRGPPATARLLSDSVPPEVKTTSPMEIALTDAADATTSSRVVDRAPCPARGGVHPGRVGEALAEKYGSNAGDQAPRVHQRRSTPRGRRSARSCVFSRGHARSALSTHLCSAAVISSTRWSRASELVVSGHSQLPRRATLCSKRRFRCVTNRRFFLFERRRRRAGPTREARRSHGRGVRRDAAEEDGTWGLACR